MKKKLFIIVLLSLMLCISCGKKVEESPVSEEKEPEKPVKKVSIVDTDSNLRPIAVMINTHKDARPQSGLSDAYIVYELMVEGGITRMMALYTQDFDEAKIGSIRSSRHNYLDYVMENDAIYIHWGGSYVAYDHLKELKLDRIDGMVYGDKYFTTDKSLKRSIEHTRFSSSDLIKQAIQDKKFRTTTDKGWLLNYTADEVDLSGIEGAKVANNITLKYSSYQTVGYEYNSEEKTYYRSMSGVKHTDLVTGEQYKFKNIICYDVKYNSYDNTKLRDLKNIGSGDGVYITNGYSIPIKWEKKTRDGKTKYMYQDGTELKVSDGNTFIQIYPTDGTLTIN